MSNADKLIGGSKLLHKRDVHKAFSKACGTHMARIGKDDPKYNEVKKEKEKHEAIVAACNKELNIKYKQLNKSSNT